jgi:hypothetical protein
MFTPQVRTQLSTLPRSKTLKSNCAIYFCTKESSRNLPLTQKLKLYKTKTESLLCSVPIMPCCENHDAEPFTLPELQMIFRMQSAAQEIFIDLVGECLDERVQTNDKTQDSHSHCAPHSFAGQRVTFKASYFLKRISRYSRGSPSCCVAALVYLERFLSRFPSIELTSATFQRLVLVASMTADKYLEDDTYLHNRSW